MLRRYVYAAVTGLVYGLGVAGAAASAEAHFAFEPEKISSIQGYIKHDPRRTRDGNLFIELELELCGRDDLCTGQARGSIHAFVPGQSLCTGTLVQLNGTYRPEKTSFDHYFSADSCKIIHGAPPLQRIREYWRSKCLEKLENRPWGALSAALLLGFRDNLDPALSDAYKEAGCAHILALSGMHLAVLSSLVALLLKRMLGLNAAAVTGSIIMFLYVVFVGAQASLIRALLMFCIAAFALIRGYPGSVSAIISCAFLLQMAIDASAARELSFILSYSALSGIIFLSSSIDELLTPYIPPILGKPFSASLGAFIATAAICACYFGILRPAGLLAGLLLAPLGSFLLLGSLLYMVLSFSLPVAAEITAGIMNGIYFVNEQIVIQAAKIPGIETVSPILSLLLSLAISFLLVYLRKRGRQKRLQFEPFSQL